MENYEKLSSYEILSLIESRWKRIEAADRQLDYDCSGTGLSPLTAIVIGIKRNKSEVANQPYLHRDLNHGAPGPFSPMALRLQNKYSFRCCPTREC